MANLIRKRIQHLSLSMRLSKNLQEKYPLIRPFLQKCQDIDPITQGASLAFFSLLALVPTLILVFKISTLFHNDYTKISFLLPQAISIEPFTKHLHQHIHQLTFPSIFLIFFSLMNLLSRTTRIFSNLQNNPQTFITPRLLGLGIILAFPSTFAILNLLLSLLGHYTSLPSRLIFWLSVLSLHFVSIALIALMYAITLKASLKKILATAIMCDAWLSLGKWACNSIFVKITTYRLLYGTLVALPWLMIWVWLVWIIILIGAILLVVDAAS